MKKYIILFVLFFGGMSFADIAAEEIKDRIAKTDINTLTPIEALNLIYELKKLI